MGQPELARRIGFSRSHLSMSERGGAPASREFWAQCDHVLATGGLFVHEYDRISEVKAAETREAADRIRAAHDMRLQGGASDFAAADPAAAAAAYRVSGWPVQAAAGGLWLVTGTAIDALEVPRPAGVLAASWWLSSAGAPDPVRGLPGLPHPAFALAVIDAGPVFYFLAEGGQCLWPPGGDPAADQDGIKCAAVVRWHSHGSRIPAPPSPPEPGPPVVWHRVPAGAIRLPSPVAMLDLLARAITAAARPHTLILPGGVSAVLAQPPRL